VVNHEESEDERENLFNEIKEMIPDFVGYFSQQVSGVGSSTFVRNNIQVKNTETIQILTADELAHIKRPNGNSYYPRIMQVISLKNPNLTIYNFHGIPGSGKQDTPERKLQTERLLETLGKDGNPKILVGDFNLEMETKAVSDLENNMKNLVKEYGFTTTRNHYYENYITTPFSDYVFVSNDLQIKDFEVLSDEVSDHLALSLEFEVL